MGWWMNPRVVRHNIKGLPKKMIFQSWAEESRVNKKIREWKDHPETKIEWLDKKRRSSASALAEFKALYQPSEFFADFGKNDDSIKIFYRTAQPKG